MSSGLVETVAQRCGATVEWTPVLLGKATWSHAQDPTVLPIECCSWEDKGEGKTMSLGGVMFGKTEERQRISSLTVHA